MDKILTTPMECFFLLCALCFSAGAMVFYVGDDFYNQHIFLFFDLALSAAYTGFLLTALPAWLGFYKDLKWLCLALLALFCLMAAVALFSLIYARLLACIYWLALCAAALYMSAKSRQFNSVIWILLIFCALKFAYFFSEDARFLYAMSHVNSAALMLINFRISLAICNDSFLNGAHFMPNVYYKNLSVFALLLCAVAAIFEINYQFLVLASAFFMLARLKDYHYLMLLKIPYIACFYACFALLALTYFIYAFFDNGFHLILLCGIALHIILVFNIAGLRHHGIKLRLLKPTIFSIALVLISMLARFYEYYVSAVLCLSIAFFVQFILLFIIFSHNAFQADA